MNHNEAVEQMTAERYLLDELTPEVRDAFEEHLFGCRDCTLDLRAAALLIEEAKVQLPQFGSALRPQPIPIRTPEKKRQWFAWLSPAFAVPAIAALLLVVGYQNLATIPALRSAAAQPQVLPWVSVHVGTRGAEPIAVMADRRQGVVLLVDMPQQASYTSYAFELFDSQGQRIWKSASASPADSVNGTLSLMIPGQGLRQGAYSLAISGVQASGESTEIGRRSLAVTFGN